MFWGYCAVGFMSAVLIAAMSQQISFWWLLPLFLGCTFAMIILHVIVTVLLAFIAMPKKPVGKYLPFWHFWVAETVDIALKLLRVKVHFSGEELMPKNEKFLMVSNHLSIFDPLVGKLCFRNYPLSYVSKPENFKIPVACQFARMCGFLPIDREDSFNAMETINESAELIKNDVMSVAIYPEGTRSKSGELLEFRNGSFSIARRAKSPIVVMVCRNTEKIFKNFPLRRTDVYVDVIDVIPYETVKSTRTNVIGGRVHETMLEFQQKTAHRG